MTVRSASLLEQRGFEPGVLFVVSGAYERLKVSAGATALQATRDLFSERSAGKIAENSRTSAVFQGGKRPKRTGSSNPLRSSNEAQRTVILELLCAS